MLLKYVFACGAVLFLFGINTGCRKQLSFVETPTQRVVDANESLRKILVSAPFGWLVTYFPRTDSLFFTDLKQKLTNEQGETWRRQMRQFGYGGFRFVMTFDKNGTLSMRSDISDDAIKTPRTSEFEIKQNSFTQLTFTTHTYIHQLVNERHQGSSDFLYVGYDRDSNLVFRTSQYDFNEPAREYITFTKITSAQQRDTCLQQGRDNRKYFEDMKNPQLVISTGGSRILFRSDVFVRTSGGVEEYKFFLSSITQQRFYVFRKTTVPPQIPGDVTPEESVGLGSGYVGTPEGMAFHAGLRYNKDLVFVDFQRVGKEFRCELMRHYDPQFGQVYFRSKHMAAGGQPTGVVARVIDTCFGAFRASAKISHCQSF